MTIQSITLSQLKASTENPRKTFDQSSIEGLALSIKQDGLLQNLVVAKPKGKQKFIIIAGERRFRALQFLLDKGEISNDYTVQVEVKEGLTEQETHRIATVENVQRENLSPAEEAGAIAALLQNGEKIDDVAAQTGLSVSTINRRLALSNLCNDAKKALSDKEITLSQAEALTLGTHEQQLEMLDIGLENWSAEEIRERLTDAKANVAMALFPRELYTGTFSTDLFASDATTYFDDTEQFLALQKQAVEKLAAEYKGRGFEPVVILEDGSFMNWKYRKAGEGEKGGVFIEFNYGNVEVHENLVSRELDRQTDETTAGNPFAKKRVVLQYGRPLCEYIAMHKTLAVQKALFDNRRIVKEVAVLQMLGESDWTQSITLHVHAALRYFEEEKNPPFAYIGLEEIAKALTDALNVKVKKDETAWSTLLKLHHSIDNLYEAVKALSDESLDDLHLFLSTLTFGQGQTGKLDADANSLFNRVAKDLGVDMRDYWTPDEAFLTRRNKAQLEALITASGTKKRFGNILQGKKADLVKKLAKHFQSLLTKKKLTDEERETRNWLPEVMQFPAIDPDAAAAVRGTESESEDFSSEEGVDEEVVPEDAV